MPCEPPVDGHHVTADLLAAAVQHHASDIHLDPMPGGYAVRFRVDGLLGPPMTLSAADGRALVARLMVMAQLLTYRMDQPQEGRFTLTTPGAAWDCRLAVIPAAGGVRAAVRLPADGNQLLSLNQLQLPPAAALGLTQFAMADSGLLLLCGPAGAGKTTTIYALLQHLATHHADVSIVTLEDPIERRLPGITQIQVSDTGSMTYERALRSVLRQDPQVLMLGEIRDAAAAALALQAALSGHRLICTLHAHSCGSAIGRLLEMQLEPYQITSCLWGVMSQRLVRRKHGDGYRGRVPVAEFAMLTPALRNAILGRADAASLDEAVRRTAAHQTLRQSGLDLVASGVTDESEVQRVLGPAVGGSHE